MRPDDRLIRAGCLAIALLPALADAASCGSEPSGFGSAAAFQSWRTWCSCTGGRPPATFNEAQRVGCRGAGSSAGTAISGDSPGTIIGRAAGKALADAIFGDPEKDAQRAAEAAQAAELAAAEQQAREIAAAERAAALLGQMIDVEPPPPAAPGFAGNELGLLLGDAPIPLTAAAGGDVVMPHHTARPAPRNEPRAVVKPPEAAAVEPALFDQLLPDPPPAAAAPVARQAPRIDSFNKGVEHGSGCYSQNAGPTCSAAAPEQFDACLADYRAGFEVGERTMKTEIGNAYRAGQRARAAVEANNGASQSGAVGTCRIEWIKSYNSGYAGAPPP